MDEDLARVQERLRQAAEYMNKTYGLLPEGITEVQDNAKPAARKVLTPDGELLIIANGKTYRLL